MCRFDRAVILFVCQNFDIISDYEQANPSDSFVNAFIVGATNVFFDPAPYNA